MATASLDDFLALNEQLAALIDAGVPLDMGLPEQRTSAAEQLKRINATIVRRVHRGESLDEALEGDDAEIPATFRSAMQFGLRTGKISETLDTSVQVAESVDDSRFTIETAFIYPLIICVIAYLGLIGFSLYLVPTLDEMYTSLNLTPGPGLRVLHLVRETLPYWAIILPIVLLAAVSLWSRAKRRATTGNVFTGPPRWLPGTSQTLFQERCSRFAASLAALLDNQVPFQEAVVIAGEASGDANLIEGANSLAAADQRSHLPADDGPIAMQFPPFLRWAIWHADATIGRARALEIAARMYREAAARRAERLRTFAPMVVLVLVGGTVTLLYGLTLFIPVVELLRTLAS
jgi:general secretion pathway protein F